jgi:tetratricopeptide (TPR) repeat protein
MIEYFACIYQNDFELVLKGAGSESSDSQSPTAEDSLAAMSNTYEVLHTLTDLAFRAKGLAYLDTALMLAKEHVVPYCQYNAFFSWHYGHLLVITGHDDEALAAYAMSGDATTCMTYAMTYIDHLIKLGMYDKALENCKRYKSRVKGTEMERRMSDCFAGLGDHGKAISGYTKHLKEHSEDKIVLLHRAQSYFGKKDLEKAAADAREVVAADSLNCEGWCLMGMIAKQSADPQAQSYFEKAMALSFEGTPMRARVEEAMK